MSELLLVPGLNNTAAVFDDVRAALPAGVRAHAHDLPPLPSVEAIAAALLASAPPRFWLAGFSFGGYVALAVAEAAPERLQGLALICAGSGADSMATIAKRRESMAIAARGGYEEMAASSTAPFHPDSLQRPELLQRRREIVRAYGAERYIAHAQACIDRPDRTALLDVVRPTLVVTTSHDAVVPPAGLRALAEGRPHVRFVQIDGAGHLLPLEQPRALAQVLGTWMLGEGAPA